MDTLRATSTKFIQEYHYRTQVNYQKKSDSIFVVLIVSIFHFLSLFYFGKLRKKGFFPDLLRSLYVNSVINFVTIVVIPCYSPLIMEKFLKIALSLSLFISYKITLFIVFLKSGSATLKTLNARFRSLRGVDLTVF